MMLQTPHANIIDL